MLLDLLKEKRCFKLVCGAGNEDVDEVEKLVTLYSKAGCNFFDLCAKPEIVDAAKRGLERAGINKDRYLCCSVGIKGDPHVSKANIDSKKCISCGACKNECLQKAVISGTNTYEINRIRCIGCSKCLKVCPVSAISIESEFKNLEEILPPIIEKGVDCIELHVLGDNEEEIYQKWNEIQELFKGTLSVYIDRTKFSNNKVLQIINRMTEKREPYTTIVQAGGNPMAGGKDDFKSTLQTVAMAEVLQESNIPVHILLSGGTNSKSTELAKICDIDVNGVAIGSFARKIVSEYISREDFLENEEIFNKALKIAKNLVDVSLRNMK